MSYCLPFCESRIKTVEWDDILEACVVEPDETMFDAPWNWQDDLGHTVERAGRDSMEDARGHYRDEDGQSWIVRPNDAQNLARWYRERGCSRQVAAEMVAQQHRQTVSHVACWRANGGQWWQVSCEFSGRYDALGGIDSEDFAHDECRLDIARNVAAELEADGYKVTGQPSPEPRARYSQLKIDCWPEESHQ